jgi:hypothetical protein
MKLSFCPFTAFLFASSASAYTSYIRRKAKRAIRVLLATKIKSSRLSLFWEGQEWEKEHSSAKCFSKNTEVYQWSAMVVNKCV